MYETKISRIDGIAYLGKCLKYAKEKAIRYACNNALAMLAMAKEVWNQHVAGMLHDKPRRIC